MDFTAHKSGDRPFICRCKITTINASSIPAILVAPLDAAEDPKRVAGATFPHLLPREPERYEKVAYVHLAPDHEFEFPDIFKDGKRPSEELNRLMEQTRAEGGLKPAKDATEGGQEASSQPLPQPSQPSAGRLPRWFTS